MEGGSSEPCTGQGSAPPGAAPLGPARAALAGPHAAFSLCAPPAVSLHITLSSSCEDTGQIESGPRFHFIAASEALSPNPGTSEVLGVRAPTHGFGEHISALRLHSLTSEASILFLVQ